MHKCEKAAAEPHICEDCNTEFDSFIDLQRHACSGLVWGSKSDFSERRAINSESESVSDEDYLDELADSKKKRKSILESYSDDNSDSDSKNRKQKRRKVKAKAKPKSDADSKDRKIPSRGRPKHKVKRKVKAKNHDPENAVDSENDGIKSEKTNEKSSKAMSESASDSNSSSKTSKDTSKYSTEYNKSGHANEINSQIVTSNSKLISCPDCGAQFSREGTLKIHMRTHTGDFPYKCIDCGEKFVYYASMKSHMLIHSDMAERPYVCDDCGAKFAAETSLEEHVKMHNQKSNSIKVCDKCKTLMSGQRDHTCSKEPEDERPHICGKCGVRYRAESTLLAHLHVHKTQD